jgi:thymidylate synthase (FAD)
MFVDDTELMVRHKRLRGDSTHKKATPTALRTVINNWSTQQRDEISRRDGGFCSCGEAGTIVDHIIPVAKSLKHALDVDNLQLLCTSCDRSKTASEQGLADRKMQYDLVSPDIVVSIESVGIRESYDLVLDNPHHNFMGNGIITHNSYNEVSGRYTQMKPRFWRGDEARVQQGKMGNYFFVPGSADQTALYRRSKEVFLEEAWKVYINRLEAGIAKEQAREDLPLSLMTQFYATCNPRNLMQFLALRNDVHALKEIRDAAMKMEAVFADVMPMSYNAYKEERR